MVIIDYLQLITAIGKYERRDHYSRVVDKAQDVLIVQIPSGTLSRVSIHSVTKLDERLGDKDFQVFIDLALDLGDKKWFDELVE